MAILDVVTNKYAFGARRLWRWEVLLLFSYRRGRKPAARVGVFSLSTGQAANRLYFKRDKYCHLTERSYRGLKESLQSVTGS
ncbi:hypothetical protein FTH31_19595 [Salmonella enterica]|nr:hypothetical protein [Salmonella enterica]EDL3528941.1 hypothetical protein [Salmonella enterica subsp. enterica serovar Newport]